jgi:hypothetical protein
VLVDHQLNGAEVMREILIELGKQDDIALKELEFESWTEENQTSDRTNPYIYQAIMDALRKHDSRVGEFEVPNRKP